MPNIHEKLKKLHFLDILGPFVKPIPGVLIEVPNLHVHSMKNGTIPNHSNIRDMFSRTPLLDIKFYLT